MNIRAAAVFSTMILSIGCANAQPQEQKLILSVGGGLPAARSITIELLDAGDFRATGSGAPFTDTGVTQFRHHRAIGEPSSAHILALARKAAVEWRGTGEPSPDCKWATLKIQGADSPVDTGSGCISDAWFSRPSIKEFLASLDQELPAGWTVSEVLSH
jgi:hypothetical protein